MSKKHRIAVTAAGLILAAAVSFSFAQKSRLCKSAGGCGCTSSAEMRDMTTQELVKDMGLGINLGNTFESCGDWINGSTVSQYETAWGSPIITKSMIDGYKAAGFKTVRIPVAWSNLMTDNKAGGTYTISADLLDRVQQVVDWVLGNDMYAIVNIHHDNWINGFSTDSAECMNKYTRIWEQVSAHFKDYSDYLMLESLNEEGVWDDVWYIWGDNKDDMAAKTRAYGLLNAINQKFVDVVRDAGGNNGDRHLLIAGYATDIDRTVQTDFFKMPTDPKNRCAVSVHFYDPFGFTHLDKDETWAKMLMTWGTQADINQLNTQMNKVKTTFVDNGIPVIVGEYGFASGLPRDTAEVRKYTLAVAKAVLDRDMLPILWDVQLNQPKGEIIYYYDRHTASFADKQLMNGFRELAGLEPVSVRHRIAGTGTAMSATRPSVALKGSMLSVSSSAGTEMKVRLIDVKGKTRARFNISGNGSYSLKSIPAGKYFVDIRGAGVKNTVSVVVR